MSVDYVELHRLIGDLSLRALSPAELDAVQELLGGGMYTHDRRSLDACYRLSDLRLAQGTLRGGYFVASPLLLDLKRADLLGVLGGLTR